jgi:hypothetical protein
MPLPLRRQRSEQYFTLSQSRSHFFRQVKGRPQAAQVLLGKSPFFCILAKGGAYFSSSSRT